MTPEEVQALVGPPSSEDWNYRNTILVSFSGNRAYSFFKADGGANGESTILTWTRDGPLQREVLKHESDGTVTKMFGPVSSAEMPVLKDDPTAKVARLYGTPTYMTVYYRYPLAGSFQNGRLVY